jgi:hypothetical protein
VKGKFKNRFLHSSVLVVEMEFGSFVNLHQFDSSSLLLLDPSVSFDRKQGRPLWMQTITSGATSQIELQGTLLVSRFETAEG